MIDPLTNHIGLDPINGDSGQIQSISNLDPLTDNIGLDPINGDSGHIAGLDWERDGWRISIDGAPAITISKDELLLTQFSNVDVIVVEQPHMRERNVYSVAQVYTEIQLSRLLFKDKLKLFPAKLTYKASRFAGNVDANDKVIKDKDAESIAIYALAHPAQLQSWKFFKLPGEDPSRLLWSARDQLRNELREALNPLRVAWNNKTTTEKYELPEVKQFCLLLDDSFDAIPENAKALFGIKRSRNGIRVERMSVALTIYLAVYDRQGNLRTRPDGEFIGSKFIRDAIGLSHSHRPNMARSQLTWHGMRHYKGTRCEYMRALRNFITFLSTVTHSHATKDIDPFICHSGRSTEMSRKAIL